MPRFLTLLLSWSLLFCGAGVVARAQAPAAQQQPRGVVRIAKVVGDVSVTDVASTLRSRVALNSLVLDGQVVETGRDSSVVLVFSNGAVINVKADSRLEVTQFLQNPFSDAFKVRDALREPSTSTTKLFLRKGEIVSQVKKLNREAGSSFTVETPVGAAGIRGTAFLLSYLPTASLGNFTLSMTEGLIRFLPIRGRSVEVAAGKELAFAAAIDAATGQVRSVPEMPALKDVPPATQAALQQALTEALGAAISIEFSAGTPGTNGAFSADTSTTTTAVPSTSSATDPVSVLAAPPPTPATQRTTPGDGE